MEKNCRTCFHNDAKTKPGQKEILMMQNREEKFVSDILAWVGKKELIMTFESWCVHLNIFRRC